MSKLSNEQKEKIKKHAIFLLMGIVCLGSIYLIFAPSDADKEKEMIGFNADIPDPKQDEIIGSKQDAYEQEQMKQKEQERMKSLQDMAYLLEEESSQPKVTLMDVESDNKPTLQQNATPSSRINNSVSAYQDINKTLGNFYEQPKADPEKEEMKRKLEELEAKMQEKDDAQNSMDEQLALMEKSYEMAAKYMPQSQNQGAPFEQTSNNSLSSRLSNYNGSSKSSSGDKIIVSPVKHLDNRMVSALHQEFTNSELFEMYDQVRNTGFNTLGGEMGVSEKNTISAVVQGEQTLVDGQSVRLRLTEPLMAGTVFVPENTLVTGQTKVQGERLEIIIASIEYQGTILPVELTAYDSDGQKGVYIPGSLELNAGKEILANMGNTMGTSFTMTQSASSQIASDVSKGAIQGVSAYMQKKIRQVKVTLKSGYRVMLMPKK